MSTTVDDDPDYTDETVPQDHVGPLTDPSAVPPDKGDPGK